MGLSVYLRRSIGLTQAVAVLFASLLVSLLLIAAQLAYTFRAQLSAADQLSEEVLALAEGGATTASWTLDDGLAVEVVQSMITLGDVQTAELRDESGAVLAQAEHVKQDYSAITRWFSTTFIGTASVHQRELSVTAGGASQRVGTLTVSMAPEQTAKRFLAIAGPVLIVGLMQALAISVLLLWISSKLITTPLRRAAAAIAKIDPENPKSTELTVLPNHQDNELGHLLKHTNRLITRLGSVQKQLRKLATHDPLTELPNRSFLVARLERAVARANRTDGKVAVLFLDLDEFKRVNDSHGHSYGDDLLLQVAGRLRRELRANDSVGRLGGDEFLIIAEGIALAEDVVPTLQRIQHSFSQPFDLGIAQVDIGCSIGVAMYPADGAHADDLIRHADMAMYQAKHSSGNQALFFAREMSERMQSRLATEAALRRALEQNQFKLAYQPKIEASSGRLVGCETLLRWQSDDRLITASEFIDVAERIGIMTDIGHFVLDQACAQASEWTGRFGALPIAINVSAQQLRESGFVDRVRATIKRYGVAPNLLEFEITESVLIEELDHAVEKLSRLREDGFVVSIDDFGTGYSSLAYLTQLPADSLKIDRSFVSGANNSEIVLNMILAVAKALDLTTVAEGVETLEQRDYLINKGCDVLQGYLLGKPLLADDFEQIFLSTAA